MIVTALIAPVTAWHVNKDDQYSLSALEEKSNEDLHEMKVKMAFNSPMGHHEHLVMPFSLL